VEALNLSQQGNHIGREIEMKINQVAELVGITNKNIRFYEDQGLIDPKRDPSNGYREYSLEDAEQLKKIRLLRQLGVSCENIRKLSSGDLSLEKCMSDRIRELDTTHSNIEHTEVICSMLSDEASGLQNLDADKYLGKIRDMEKGGVRFMNVNRSDVKKRRSGAIIAAAAVVIFMIAAIALIIWADGIDPAPKGILIFMIAVFGIVIVGVLIALSQRLKELKGGELDEADKY
jgi:DNA-binding transcriptional MerR regulator